MKVTLLLRRGTQNGTQCISKPGLNAMLLIYPIRIMALLFTDNLSHLQIGGLLIFASFPAQCFFHFPPFSLLNQVLRISELSVMGAADLHLPIYSNKVYFDYFC